MRLLHSKDRSIVWTCFLIKVVGIWIATNRVEQLRRNLAFVYTLTALSIAMGIALRDLHFSWGNFNECVYIFCNILYLMNGFFKIAVLSAQKRKFFDVVIFTDQTFMTPIDDQIEQKILMDCKRLCDWFIVFIMFCVQGGCSGYAITPLVENIGKNESERILPFNLWIDFPTGKSPYFEVLFTIQILCVYHVAISYFCFDNFLCILCLNVTSQFRILQHRMITLSNVASVQISEQNLKKSQTKSAIKRLIKLKSCIRHHQALINYCRQLENVFTLIILGEILFVALLLCCLGFQLFLMIIPPARRISLVLSMMAVSSQLFMFSYCWDGLMRESGNIGQAAFAGPWFAVKMDDDGKALREDVLMIIMRANKACCLTAGGFFPVSLETFTAVLSTAVSYFTLLRHSAPDLMNT